MGDPNVVSIGTAVDHDAPKPRAKTATGAIVAGGRSLSRSPMALVLGALLGGGGVGGGMLVGGAGFDSDRVAIIEADVSKGKERDAEHDRQLTEQRADLTQLQVKTGEAEAKLWRESARTQRWMADVLVKHSGALAAIAKQLDVEVDVSVPPMIVEVEP